MENDMMMGSGVMHQQPDMGQGPNAPPPPPYHDGQQDPQQQQQQQQQQHHHHVGNPVTTVRKTSCDMCTQIKVKCSGETPCKRCAKKGLECVYSLSKKRGPPKGKKRNMAMNKRIRAHKDSSSEPSGMGHVQAQHFTPTQFAGGVTLEAIRERVQVFSDQRNWEQFHTPRNLVLALTGEVGELASIFQWKNNIPPGLGDFTLKDRVRVADELADILIYTTRLADRCGIDLANATLEKIQKNDMKYPKDKSMGSSKKYTEFDPAMQAHTQPHDNSGGLI
ncbi:dCTP pyrophosphatase 1 [Hondaea fermentalgiana]|uniref:dCTP pyrophosphatase 1 n=1 Tax=Hondaea fermentalgiana TaxID=2315210 RepID=A0A2R5GI89_9STRA|nr:dCTP pyrophosphatase 1 [Hondaea fermentalgiana]|eukprot:GBG28001.1 dCTP pyrophosphatase 1 [Hondaea fermentalgiana]